jgi:hypothetical protein
MPLSVHTSHAELRVDGEHQIHVFSGAHEEIGIHRRGKEYRTE